MHRTGNALWRAAGLIAVTAWLGTATGAAAGASSITGTITFDGKVPNLAPLTMDADPVCARKHSAPVANEMLVLGPAIPWRTSWSGSRRDSRPGRPGPFPRLRW